MKFTVVTRIYIVFLFLIFILSGCRNIWATPAENSFSQSLTITQPQTSPTTISNTTQIPDTFQIKSTPNPTLFPTLTIEQHEIIIQNLLRTNSGCQLPCWWGIEPGKTTWDETEQFIQQFGGVTSVFQREGNEIYHSTGGFDLNREYIYNRISFFELNGVIISIEVHGIGYQNPSKFSELWTPYTPEKLIPEYGPPTRVWLQSIKTVVEGEPGPTMPYDLWVFYDQLGILIRYQGQVIYRDTYKMCPTFQEGGNLVPTIDLYLKSPEKQISLESLTDYANIPKSQIFLLREAANLTLDEFYALYNQNKRTPCFETPKNIWP